MPAVPIPSFVENSRGGTSSVQARCTKHMPIRAIWWGHRCPKLWETDALQLATNALLDAADGLLASGLDASGYKLIVTEPCESLQQPAQRTGIVSYLAERRLSLVFAAPGRVLRVSDMQLFTPEAANFLDPSDAAGMRDHPQTLMPPPPPPRHKSIDPAHGIFSIHGTRHEAAAEVRRCAQALGLVRRLPSHKVITVCLHVVARCYLVALTLS
eukprot:524495-Pleurochrysis_carterae.AAC.7